MRRKQALVARAARSVPVLSAAALLASFASRAAADPTVIVDSVDGDTSQSSTVFPNSSNFTIFNGQLLSGNPLIVGDVGTGVVDNETNGWFTDGNNNINLVDGMATGPGYLGPAEGPSAIIGNQPGSNGTVNIGIHSGDPNYQNIVGLGLWNAVGDVDIAAQRGSTGTVYMYYGGLSILDGDINVGGTTSAAGGTATLTLASNLAGINTYFNDNQFNGEGTNLRVWAGGTVNLGGGGAINIGNLINDGGTFNWTQGTLHIIDSNFDIGSAGDFFRAGFTLNSGMTLQIDHQLTVNSTLYVNGGTLDAGTLIQNNGALINFVNGNLTVENGGINTSQIINDLGLLPIDDLRPADGMNGNNFALNGGQILTLNNGGVLTVEPGDTFTVNGGALIAASITNAAAGFSFTEGSVSLTDSTMPTIIDPVDGNFFTTGNLTLNQNQGFALAGTLTVGDVSTASLQVDTTAPNNGLTGSGLTTGTAVVGNQAGSNGTVTIGDSNNGYQGQWTIIGELNVGVAANSMGNVTIDYGNLTVDTTINLGGSDAGPGGTASLTILPNGTLNGDNTSNNNNLNLYPLATININGGALYTGYVTPLGGTFNFNSGIVQINNGDIGIGAGSANDLLPNGLTLNGGDSFTVENGNTDIGNNPLQVHGGAFSTNTISFENPGSANIDFTFGSVTVEDGASFDTTNLTNSNDPLPNGFNLDAGQILSLFNDAVLQIPSGNSFSINGGGMTTGSINDLGGGFQFNAGFLILQDPSVPVVIDSGGLLKSNYSADGSDVSVDQTRVFLSIAGSLTVGDSGTGALQVYNSGTITDPFAVNYGLVSGAATVGLQPGSKGTAIVGDSVAGNMGLWVVNGDADIAANPKATGCVTVDDGDFTVQGDVNVGGSSDGSGGTGTLTVNAEGTINANYQGTNFNFLRVYAGGIVNLNGGTINVGSLDGEGGIFNFNTGTLNVAQSVGVGDPSDLLGPYYTLQNGDFLNVAGNTNVDSNVFIVDGGALTTGTLSFSSGLLDFSSASGVGGTVIVNNGGFDVSGFFNDADASAGMSLLPGQTLRALNNGAIIVPQGFTFAVNGGLLEAGSILDSNNIAGQGFQFNAGGLQLDDPTVPVIIDSGGQLKSLASPDGSSVLLTFDNANFTGPGALGLTIAGPVIVGNTGKGDLNIQTDYPESQNGVSGGATTGPLTVGQGSGSVGTVEVGDLSNFQFGELTTNGEADIAANTGSKGTVTVGYGNWIVNGNLYVGGTSAGAGGTGTLTVGNSSDLALNGSLTVWNNGHVNLNAPSTGLNSLTVVGNGVVNVNGSLLINYGSSATDPVSTIAGYLKSGYGQDTWTGPGIDSSAAAANPGRYALGYADGNLDAGTPAQANQIVVEFTLAGDSNLDGRVNFADLLAVAQNFNHTLDTHHNPIDWADGDFNYDGKVNFADLLLVAQNFNRVLTAGQLEQLPGSFVGAWDLALADVQTAESNDVPEPAAVGLLAVAAGGLLRRRRRDRRRA